MKNTIHKSYCLVGLFQQLVLTTGLLTVIVYLYTVIAFNFFRKFYNKSEGDDPDWKCHNMFTVSYVIKENINQQTFKPETIFLLINAVNVIF